jgi:hypothetical protein
VSVKMGDGEEDLGCLGEVFGADVALAVEVEAAEEIHNEDLRRSCLPCARCSVWVGAGKERHA